MKLKSPLSDIMGSRIKVDLIRLFLSRGGRFSGRECARATGYSPPATIKALNELSASGVLWKERFASAFMYSFNEQYVLAKTLNELFNVENEIVDRVVKEFARELRGKLDSVIVFGSVARGEEGESSDIDMVISFRRGIDPKQYRSEVIEAANSTYSLTGSSVDSFTIERNELDKKMEGKGNTGMWKDIFGDKPVILYRPRGDKLERFYFSQGARMRSSLRGHKERDGSLV